MAPNKAVAAAIAVFAAQTASAKPVDFEAKVVGGSQAKQADWPWIVSLRRGQGGGQGQHTCGGSLVSADTVVTAAHCSDGQPASSFSVLAGSNVSLSFSYNWFFNKTTRAGSSGAYTSILILF